jgi:hypothetical protein
MMNIGWVATLFTRRLAAMPRYPKFPRASTQRAGTNVVAVVSDSFVAEPLMETLARTETTATSRDLVSVYSEVAPTLMTARVYRYALATHMAEGAGIQPTALTGGSLQTSVPALAYLPRKQYRP